MEKMREILLKNIDKAKTAYDKQVAITAGWKAGVITKEEANHFIGLLRLCFPGYDGINL